MTRAVTLSAEQRDVARTVCARTTGSCLVTGDAGTGKTTLLAAIIRWFLARDRSVLVLAPTHAALRQFSNRLVPHPRLGLSTVAKYLGQFPIVDQASGRLKFMPGAHGGTAEADLVVIDETSMVSEFELLEIRKSSAECLVIFAGDFAQLRPVMKRQGDAYQRLHTFHLREQHRNANEILALCNRVRTAVEYPVASTPSIIVHRTRRGMIHVFLAALTSARDPREHCYLAYRNALVDHVRMRAHVALYGAEPFVAGQWLRLDQMCEAGHNGSIVRVLAVRPGAEHEIPALGERFRTWWVRVENPDEGEIRIIRVARLEDQHRLARAVESLYELSAAQFFSDKLAWKSTRGMIDATQAIVRHSSPFVGTVHKSQGRSVPRVYVDTLDISTGADKRRLLYVGYSRTMHRLHVVHVPPRTRIRKRRST